MFLCGFVLRRTRRPLRLLFPLAVIFVCLGTFYWKFWNIPWLDGLQKSKHSGDTTWVVSSNNEPRAPLRPKRPSCITQSAPIIPNKRYCSWNTALQDCYETLMPVFHKQPSWVFLGDEGMANIPYFLSLQWPVGNLTLSTRRNPCQNLLYYGLPPPAGGWTPPSPKLGEGPIGRGIQQPFCMDCINCWNVKMDSGPATALSVEYLVVEYARDVSLPSLVTNTTQETVALYLNQQSPSVCVASVGLNDAAMEPPISQELYLQNLDKYLGLLQRACDNVIWISLHPVVEGDGVIQSNCKLQQWNNAVMGLIKMRDYANVYVVDIWDVSFHVDFYNPTQPGKKFYASLSRLFKSLMAGPNLTQTIAQ